MASGSGQGQFDGDAAPVRQSAAANEGSERPPQSLAKVSDDEPGSPYVAEMAAAWEAGEFTSLEQFFAEHPQAEADAQVAVRLIYEEFCLRQDAGLNVDAEGLLERFPQWRSELQIILDCHEIVRGAMESPDFPEVGEQFGEFQLLTELGRGAVGRVFLATQPSLSDRPVVVKVMAHHGREHLSLARLQHSSIVPLYLAQDHAARNLRLLCMPYVGGANLARLLQAFRETPIEQRSGKHFVDSLEDARKSAPVAMPMGGPALQFLSRASYLKSVCWIGACLADALHYAHGRGLMHLDLKPSNVLLASDGQPMLLDFHLAREKIFPAQLSSQWLGGTPGYMSPEQEQALAEVREGRPVSAVVDGRSDIYSLGLLLRELLGGPPPAAGCCPASSLRRLPGSVPAKVTAIIRQCLACDAEDRYGDAGQLAAELRHCLIELPDGAVNKPTPAKQRGRRGDLLRRSAAAAALVAALATLGAVAFHRYQRRHQADASENMWSAGGDGQHASPRLQAAEQLHSLVDQLRFLDNLDSLPAHRLRKLEAGCGEVWRGRSRLTSRSDSPLAADVEQRIRTDLLDLAILWSSLHVHLAKPEQWEQVKREAIQVLEQAEAELGGSVVLSMERQAYAHSLGIDERLDEVSGGVAPPGPRTAWEHYAVGRSLLRAGQVEQAALYFQTAVELEPGAFWPYFYGGVCAYRLGQFEAALAAFSASVALEPEKAECYYNRALAYRALGRQDLAARDFQIADRLRPGGPLTMSQRQVPES